MDRQEDLLALEIELLQAAGRRYGLMLDRLRREKRDRVRMEARRAIETAMRKHGPVRPGGGQRPPAPVPGRPPGAGRWCVVAAFGPLARWGIARLRKIFGKLCSLLGRWAGIPLGHCGKGRPPWPILAKKQEKS